MAKREATAAAKPAPVESEFLNLSEIARMLNKDRSTIHRWVRDGLLKAVRLPSGLPAVRRSDLATLIGASALTLPRT